MEGSTEQGGARAPMDSAFFNLEIYAIFRAITELFGEKGWDVIWRMGEIVFDQIEPTLDLPDDEPGTVMRAIGEYLKRMGYLRDVRWRAVGPDGLDYEMHDAVIWPAAERLLAEKLVLPHFSTVVMMAGLKKRCGIRATMEDVEPTMLANRVAAERWTFHRSPPSPTAPAPAR